METLKNTLKNITSNKTVINTFCPLFTSINLYVINGKREYTLGLDFNNNKIKITSMLNNPEYTITVTDKEIDNLYQYIKDDSITNTEAEKICAFLFTPLTKSILSRPVLNNPLIFTLYPFISRCLYVKFINANNNILADHTITYNTNWIVKHGKQNNPDTQCTMTLKDCIEYQRQLTMALRSSPDPSILNPFSLLPWIKFARFYYKLRNKTFTKI